MAKRSNKISYVSILVILFALIAMFLIVRNSLLLKNNVEFEATCYSYESAGEEYKVSYYYIHQGHTYYITNVEKDKPKLSSKKTIYCNKNDTTKCVLDKNMYVKRLYISIIVLLPALVFMAFEYKQKRASIKSDTEE